MRPLRRFSEINFYEELGVAENASPEEIRDAFRALVRLLHPDQQTDAQLKEMAESQMRKMNRIYAVLSDPARRCQYDEDLREAYSPAIIVNAPPPVEFRRPRRRLEWFAAALLSVGFLMWLASRNVSTPAAAFHEDAAPVAPATDISASRPAIPENVRQDSVPDDQDREAAEDARLQEDLKKVIARREAALRAFNRVAAMPPARLTPPVQPAPPKPAAPRIDVSELPSSRKPAPQLALAESAPVVAAPAPAASANATRIDTPAPQNPLAGIWVYVKPPAGQHSALPNTGPVSYPPEFIQTSITEENGTLHGRYRSRFQISDRPISPDVNFTFTGSPNGPTVIGQWVGAGGAKGRITLRLTSENLLRVDWVTLQFGTEQGLASGSAILTRRTE